MELAYYLNLIAQQNLKKQLDTIDPEKRETASETKARKKKASEKDNPIIDITD